MVEEPYDDGLMLSDSSDSESYSRKKKKKRMKPQHELEVEEKKCILDTRGEILHPFWDAIPCVGYYKRNNQMRNLLSVPFYISTHNNIVYHREHQLSRINRYKGPSLPEESKPRDEKFRKASPQGIPHTAWEVNCLVHLLTNEYVNATDRILAYLFLQELYFIARGVVPTIRDQAMNYIMDPSNYNPETRPYEVSEYDIWLRTRALNKPTGIPNVALDWVLHIDKMAQYAILYGHPGPNFFQGVVMDYAYRVNRRLVDLWLRVNVCVSPRE